MQLCLDGTPYMGVMGRTPEENEIDEVEKRLGMRAMLSVAASTGYVDARTRIYPDYSAVSSVWMSECECECDRDEESGVRTCSADCMCDAHHTPLLEHLASVSDIVERLGSPGLPFRDPFDLAGQSVRNIDGIYERLKGILTVGATGSRHWTYDGDGGAVDAWLDVDLSEGLRLDVLAHLHSNPDLYSDSE